MWFAQTEAEFERSWMEAMDALVDKEVFTEESVRFRRVVPWNKTMES